MGRIERVLSSAVILPLLLLTACAPAGGEGSGALNINLTNQNTACGEGDCSTGNATAHNATSNNTVTGGRDGGGGGGSGGGAPGGGGVPPVVPVPSSSVSVVDLGALHGPAGVHPIVSMHVFLGGQDAADPSIGRALLVTVQD